MFCNNASTIKLSKNPVLHGRSKHIDVRFYFLRDLCNNGIIQLNYCSTGEQLAYIMTKPLKVENNEKKNLEELKLKNLKVKNYLFQAIYRTVLETI
ncbi:Copia protein, partial [Mucuna pruriens]